MYGSFWRALSQGCTVAFEELNQNDLRKLLWQCFFTESVRLFAIHKIRVHSWRRTFFARVRPSRLISMRVASWRHISFAMIRHVLMREAAHLFGVVFALRHSIAAWYKSDCLTLTMPHFPCGSESDFDAWSSSSLWRHISLQNCVVLWCRNENSGPCRSMSESDLEKSAIVYAMIGPKLWCHGPRHYNCPVLQECLALGVSPSVLYLWFSAEDRRHWCIHTYRGPNVVDSCGHAWLQVYPVYACLQAVTVHLGFWMSCDCLSVLLQRKNITDVYMVTDLMSSDLAKMLDSGYCFSPEQVCMSSPYLHCM